MHQTTWLTGLNEHALSDYKMSDWLKTRKSALQNERSTDYKSEMIDWLYTLKLNVTWYNEAS